MNERIKNIIESVLKDFTIDKIVLFGSRARNENEIDSDYDILISVSDVLTRAEEMRLENIISKELAKIDIAADVIVRKDKYIAEAKNEIGNVISYAIEEGVAL